MRYILLISVIFVAMLASFAIADDFMYHGSFLWNDIRDIKAQGNYLFCAFSEGVGVIDLRQDHSKKKIHGSIEIDGLPLKLFLFDQRLAVLTEEDEIILLDISNPLELEFLGSFTPEWEIWDLELMGDNLYAAVEYYGIARYDVSNPDNITFTDSSMYGIRVIDLQVKDSILLALDNYNGMLLYQPESDFTSPVSEILLPRPAISFSVQDDSIYAGINTTGYMVSALHSAISGEYLETRDSHLRADHVRRTGTGIVIANSVSGFEVYHDHGDHISSHLFPVIGTAGEAELFEFEGQDFVTYPHYNNGLAAYNLNDPYQIQINYPALVLANPGPVTQLEFVNSRLHTIGTNNWYEIYSLDNPESPVRTGTMINPPYTPAGMVTRGDTIYIADYYTNLIFPAVDNGIGNPELQPPFFAIANVIDRPFIEESFMGEDDLYYCLSGDYIVGTFRNRYGINTSPIAWVFEDEILSAKLFDTVLIAGLFNSSLCVYTINEKYELSLVTEEIVNGRVRDIIRNDMLLYLGANGLITASLSEDLLLTEVHTSTETGTVYQLKRQNDWLYCAAQNGLFIFDIATGVPQLLFSGGESAQMLSVEGTLFAASDSRSVKVYSLPVTGIDDNDIQLPRLTAPKITGYPNPFNPEITLVLKNFSGSLDPIAVDVFDVLGRKIRSLSSDRRMAGNRSVVWDGKDESGQKAASGVYFIRAHDETQSAVFKAVLMK